jgi:DNA-binding response OmpR family regulator
MVLDDELLICETVRRALVFDGHTVETVTNGREALARFEKDKFDLVILDYEMPDMRGDELALLFKALAPNQSIAILTGYRETVIRSLLTDVDLIISKPFNPQELRTATNRLFARG